jgi:hypothetical protein
MAAKWWLKQWKCSVRSGSISQNRWPLLNGGFWGSSLKSYTCDFKWLFRFQSPVHCHVNSSARTDHRWSCFALQTIFKFTFFFWFLLPCRLVGRCQCFEEIYCLPLQDRRYILPKRR